MKKILFFKLFLLFVFGVQLSTIAMEDDSNNRPSSIVEQKQQQLKKKKKKKKKKKALHQEQTKSFEEVSEYLEGVQFQATGLFLQHEYMKMIQHRCDFQERASFYQKEFSKLEAQEEAMVLCKGRAQIFIHKWNYNSPAFLKLALRYPYLFSGNSELQNCFSAENEKRVEAALSKLKNHNDAEVRAVVSRLAVLKDFQYFLKRDGLFSAAHEKMIEGDIRKIESEKKGKDDNLCYFLETACASYLNYQRIIRKAIASDQNLEDVYFYNEFDDSFYKKYRDIADEYFRDYAFNLNKLYIDHILEIEEKRSKYPQYDLRNCRKQIAIVDKIIHGKMQRLVELTSNDLSEYLIKPAPITLVEDESAKNETVKIAIIPQQALPDEKPAEEHEDELLPVEQKPIFFFKDGSYIESETDECLVIQDLENKATITIFKTDESKKPTCDVKNKKYTDWVHVWFDNPEKALKKQGYTEFGTKKYTWPTPEKKNEVIFLHAFAQAVDSLLPCSAKQSTTPSRRKKSQKDILLTLPGSVTYHTTGKTETGIFTYIIDLKNGQWYHRNFVARSGKELCEGYWQKGYFDVEFPPLA